MRGSLAVPGLSPSASRRKSQRCQMSHGCDEYHDAKLQSPHGHAQHSMTTAVARPSSAGGSPTGSLKAANGHRHLATPSRIRPCNACSDGTSSLFCHHPATLRNRLTVKLVCRKLAPDFADPGGIGGTTTTTGSCLPDHLARSPGPWRPRAGDIAATAAASGRPHLPSRPVPFPRWQASGCPP